MPVIVVSGMPGCGSSTAAKLLAKKLRLKYFSVGDYYKSFSKGNSETHSSLMMWKTEKGSSRKFHEDIDKKLLIEKAKQGNIVIDAKLAIRFLKNHYDYSVWLKASEIARAKRYAKRDRTGIKESVENLAEKQKLERENFKKLYGFDYFSLGKEADIVIDTEDKTAEDAVGIILKRLRKD